MSIARCIAATIAALTLGVAQAADNALLIQPQADGRLTVWHSEGETHLSDDELAVLEESAEAEGGKPLLTALGAVRAFRRENHILIVLPEGIRDNALLVDRDACGGVGLWHAAGTSSLTQDQLTELVLAAVPGGSAPFMMAGRYAKAYLTKLGVVAVFWQPIVRP